MGEHGFRPDRRTFLKAALFGPAAIAAGCSTEQTSPPTPTNPEYPELGERQPTQQVTTALTERQKLHLENYTDDYTINSEAAAAYYKQFMEMAQQHTKFAYTIDGVPQTGRADPALRKSDTNVFLVPEHTPLPSWAVGVDRKALTQIAYGMSPNLTRLDTREVKPHESLPPLLQEVAGDMNHAFITEACQASVNGSDETKRENNRLAQEIYCNTVAQIFSLKNKGVKREQFEKEYAPSVRGQMPDGRILDLALADKLKIFDTLTVLPPAITKK